MDVPEPRYARSGDLNIAYQVVGDGPLDVVIIPTNFSNIEFLWELPAQAWFLERSASFSRVILFDRRGNGMSDGIAGTTPLEGHVDDVRAVLDAVDAQQPALISTTAAATGLSEHYCSLIRLGKRIPIPATGLPWALLADSVE